MKIYQKYTPRIVMNPVLESKYCCNESRNIRFMSDRRFGSRDDIVTKEDLTYNYCPYCGKKVSLVNVYPTEDEVEQIVTKLYLECGLL